MAKLTLQGQHAVLHDFEFELRQAGIGAWFHRPRTAAVSHCLLLRIGEVKKGSCRYVTSATGEDDFVALERAFDAWREI
jgi:hypothetical protein